MTPGEPGWHSQLKYPVFDETVNEAIHGVLPEPIIWLFAKLTLLGENWLLAGIAIVAYLVIARRDRKQAGIVLAVAVTAFVLVSGLKGLLLFERPEPFYRTAPYTGYSFPSAHALGATAIYGSLAWASNWSTRMIRIGGGGFLIGVIAFSRVVIGVHYVVDVVAGVILGLGVLWFGIRFGPRRTFLLGLGIAAVTVGLGSREYAGLALGGGAGGVLGWYQQAGNPRQAIQFAGAGIGVVLIGLFASSRPALPAIEWALALASMLAMIALVMAPAVVRTNR